MFISFIGAPGAGKGTQARKLGEYLRVPHISIGDLLRVEMIEKSEIGLEIIHTLDKRTDLRYRKKSIQYFEKMASEIIYKRIMEEDCANGAILDGFPRTLNQAEELEGWLGEKLKTIIHLKCEDQTLLIRRINDRLICTNCGRVYSLSRFKGIHNEYSCNTCDAALTKREEDQSEIYKHRLDEYYEVTKSVIPFFKERQKLVEVDGTKEINVISQSIISKLKKVVVCL